MIGNLLERISRGMNRDQGEFLQIRIFRLICATVSALCLGLVMPINLLQNLPLGIHVANILLGLLGAYFFWESCRGRHFIATFILIAVLMLDVAWFWNAGSQGSVTYYYFPVMIFIVAMFRGRTQWIATGAVIINVVALFVLEVRFPQLVTPFQSASDRMLDLEAGVVCSCLALAAVTSLLLSSHDREQQRISQIAASLTASEQNYREIFNSTSDALFVLWANGGMCDVNERACAMLGVDRETLLRSKVDDFSLGLSPYSGVEAAERIRLAAAGQPQVFEWRNKRRDGSLFWSEVALRVCEIAGEKRVIAVVRDISERKHAEGAVRKNEERLRLALTATAQGWFELNVQTGVGVSSPEYLHILGYDPDTFQTTQQVWIDGMHPDDRDKAIQAYRECIASGEARALEYRRQTKAGTWKWIRSVGKIVEFDADGKPLRMYGTHADITERKELEAQLLHSQRLEAVGTLASGVAHDLNNILTPMLMASGILKESLKDPNDRELMALLDSSGKRGAAIVKQLLAFSRNMAQEHLPVDPRQLMREMAQLMRSTLPKDITVVAPEGGDLGCVLADPTQLHQVLMNLCVNSRDAMPAGGTLTLGAERVELPPPAPGQSGAPKGGPYIVLMVGDTGCGISPEIMERIFDPFFTTKGPGKGTGLGLASVHGIVRAHAGFVRVESSPGRGAVFRVFLPAMSRATFAPFERRPAQATPAAGRGECILVVDDDATVLMSTRRRLEREGYRVLSADNGTEALRIARDAAGDVQVVVTDFAMPGMDGPTLVPLLRKIAPSLRIIGVSGNDHRARTAELKRLGFAEILGKPYASGDLLQAIRRQLQTTAGPQG